MQAQGYRIIPVNPLAAPVLGEVGYPSLEAIPADIRIDIVNLFRRAEDTPPLAEESVRLQARALWLQSGIINETSMEIARSAGLLAVQDRCLMVEHRRLASQL
jgi:predicted CoA-binding protein